MAGPILNPPFGLFEGDLDAELERTTAARDKAFLNSQNEEYNRAKGAVASLINSYNIATSSAMRDQIVYTMKDYYSVLPNQLRKEVDPYIAYGPTSPLEEKRREFLKLNPSPQKPVLNEVPGEANNAQNELDSADYIFQKSDHDRQLKSFLFGSDAAGEKKTFIGLPDQRAAIRGKDNQVMILNSTDLKIKELAEKYGLPEKDVWLGQGVVPSGKKGYYIENGIKKDFEYDINLFAPPGTNPYSPRATNETAAPTAANIEHPAALNDFLKSWSTPDNKETEELKEIAKKNIPLVNRTLQARFPGYTFFVNKHDKGEFWSWGASDYNYIVTPIPGLPVHIPNRAGEKFTYFRNTKTGQFFNDIGKQISMEEIQEIINRGVK